MLNGMARFYSLINLPNMHNICHGLCWVLEQQTEQDILCQSLNFGTSRIDANDHIIFLQFVVLWAFLITISSGAFPTFCPNVGIISPFKMLMSFTNFQ